MKLKELMERVDSTSTGRIIAYIKDGIADMALKTELNFKREKINLVESQRFYDLPKGMFRMLDVRAKNHDNNDDEYRSIPRALNEPVGEDADGS
tara:strand:- start:122 stop:403 length:282 start_codon:yes stop_codon:yes gene_type:complete